MASSEVLEGPGSPSHPVDRGNPLVDQDLQQQMDSVEQERGRRIRTLTELGSELYENKVSKFADKLISYRKDIQQVVSEIQTDSVDSSSYLDKKYELTNKFSKFEGETKTFLNFLSETNTEISLKEKQSQEVIFRTVTDSVVSAIEKIKTSMEQHSVKHAPSHSNRSSVRSSKHSSSHSKSSHRSNATSELARQRAKAEAAKARLLFEKRQLDLKKEKARLEEEHLRSKANVERKKLELDADMEYLERERDAAVAQTEYEAYRDELEGECSEHNGTEIGIQTFKESERTREYVSKLSSSDENVSHSLESSRENLYTNDCAPTANMNSSVNEDLMKIFMKKDLLMQRLTHFDDRPETFFVWKSSFQNIVNELSLSPTEEFDLLLKWLGPESRRHAVSLRSSNASNPAKGLERLWERLYERYGSPEMVEYALKKKLEQFPKLGTKDNKKLYDLSDILAEIESIMENTKYNTILSYFNSSSGILPIVCKLPYHIQGKWTVRATKYKKANNVAFPPFTEFCNFIRDMSSMLNDPGFAYFGDTKDTVERTSEKSSSTKIKSYKQFPVSVRKTDVNHKSVEKGGTLESCPLHDNSKHSLNQCRTFKGKSMADRKRLLREHRICYRCCEDNTHIFKNCNAKIKCHECGSNRHPTAMHPNEGQGENLAISKNQGREGSSVNNDTICGSQAYKAVDTKCTNVCGPEFAGRSCAKIVPVKVYPGHDYEKAIKLYAILDDQSNRTLGRPEFFDIMKISANNAEQYTLVSCAGTYQTHGRLAQGFTISALDDSFTLTLPVILECNEIPSARSEIPTPEIVQYHQHLKDIPISQLDPEAGILLLIGRDLPEAHHVFEQRVGPRNSPFAQKLGFGWVIIGDVCTGKHHKPDNVNVLKTRILEDGRPTIFPQCDYKFVVKDLSNDTSHLDTDVFSVTKYDNKQGLSIEDKAFIKIMDTEFEKNQKGYWSAPLPFRTSRPKLPNNRSQALKRANMLDMTLKKNAEKREHFKEFMERIFQNGHAEVAPQLKTDEECWYLPVFGVYHPKKKDQIRAVFDSSAKFEGLSLNSVLLSGPDLTNNLVGILMRFRENSIGITGDIQQMFYQFHVHEKDRNFLRFFWYRDNDMNNELIEYRMCVHVFGNSPSPAVANYGLRKIAQNTAHSHGVDVKNFIERDFYVDDGLASLQSVDEAISLMKRTQEALYTDGQLKLHKIVSNEKAVLSGFPEEDLDKSLKTLDIVQDILPVQRSLGLSWDLESDSFVFPVIEQKKTPPTKRSVLSTVNSLFDPLGFLAPVSIGGKLLMREVTANVCDWDEPLPQDLLVKWQQWVQSLQDLKKVKICRTYFPQGEFSMSNAELHVFSDASEKAIAAVAFIKNENSRGEEYVGFVIGKSKVAPKHGHTIPRLELCASVLAVEIAEVVSEELSLPTNNITFYTDSKVVLGYLKNNTRRFYIYVTNRISRILQFSSADQWHYISTDKNPADAGTRHVHPNDLKGSHWLTGHTVLEILKNDATNNQNFPLIHPNDDDEIRPEIKSCKTVVEVDCFIGTSRFKRFSCWERLLRTVSFLTHIADSFKLENKDENLCNGWHLCETYKSVKCKNQARNFIIKQYQKEFFGGEIICFTESKPIPRNSSILTLSPFLDEEGILRVGGRLKKAELPWHEKHPILIPRQSHLATLLVTHYHQLVCHQGRHFTEGAVRNAGYWIIGGKRLISLFIHKCVKCRKLRGNVGHQKMSDLPEDRVLPAPPFSFVGVDVFGPWNVIARKTRGGVACAKRWAVLFGCQTTRAIHLELIEEMSSSSFINALRRRFYAIRGKVQEFRSDCGTNFVGATNDLKIDTINIEDDPVKNLLFKSGTVWKFNSPHSSHMGGSWERLIGVSRRVLDSVLMDNRNIKLTHEVLSTFMAEVMAIVNSRPLVPVSTDVEDPFILTPSVLLTQKTGIVVETFDHINIQDTYRAQWKQVQFLSDAFWNRWRREYIQTLQSRQKWQTKLCNIKEGDVVLMRDKTVSRNEWPLGRVIRVFPSEDDLVRKVQLRVVVNEKSVIYVRPITEVVKLCE